MAVSLNESQRLAALQGRPVIGIGSPGDGVVNVRNGNSGWPKNGLKVDGL